MASSSTAIGNSPENLFNIFSNTNDNSQTGVAILSLPKYQFEYINPALRNYIEKFGISKIIGKQISSLLGRSGVPLYKMLEETEKSGAPLSLKNLKLFNPLSHKNYHFDISAQPLTDAKNRVVRIMVDISESVQHADIQLGKNNSTHYQKILQIIDKGVQVLTPTGQTVIANETFYKLNGLNSTSTDFTPEINYTLYDLDHNQVPFDQWPFWKALNGNPVYDLEFRCVNNQSGKNFYGLFSAIPLKFDNNSDINGIVITIKDISALVKARMELESREKLLRTILDNAQDGIHLYDLIHEKYEFISAGQEKNTGYHQHELFQNFSKVLDRVHPRDLDFFKQYLEKVINDPHTEGPIEYRLKVKNGSYRWFSDNWKAIRNQEQVTVKLVGVSRDITQRKKLENSLKIKSRQLEDFNELQKNLLYMTAHDLRSPISNLKALLNLMESGNQELQELNFHSNFQELVNRMENVIGGLTDILKAQNDTEAETETIQLAGMIDNIRSENKKSLNEINGSLELNFDRDFNVRFIRSFLYSILNNLISNAIKYRSNHRKLEISVIARREKKQVIIEVSDNGTGMDLKKIGKNLFRPFKRFSTNANGTGLGLYIVYHIVKRNGGKIEVDSKVDHGTRITCRLNEY